MRIALNILGAFLVLTGAIWFLQGINVLLGSPMSGHIQWSVWGTLAAVSGIGVLVYANRRRPSPSPTSRTPRP
jgi:hypothetical protein